MAISPVSRYSNATQAGPIDRGKQPAAQAPASEKAARPDEREASGVTFDRVKISLEAQKLQLLKAAPGQVLGGVEQAIAAGGSAGQSSADAVDDPVQAALDAAYTELLDRAGKSEYLESIANPTDLSPEATAGRILGGVTGYIFKAYEMQHPEMTEADLHSFKEQVLRGFEDGFGKAKATIEELGKLDETLDTDIAETARLFHEGFESFLADQLAKFQPTPTET